MELAAGSWQRWWWWWSIPNKCSRQSEKCDPTLFAAFEARLLYWIDFEGFTICNWKYCSADFDSFTILHRKHCSVLHWKDFDSFTLKETKDNLKSCPAILPLIQFCGKDFDIDYDKFKLNIYYMYVYRRIKHFYRPDRLRNSYILCIVKEIFRSNHYWDLKKYYKNLH